LRLSGPILENIFMVFLGSLCRETAKTAIKKIDGKRRKEKSFFSSQLFRFSDFLQKVFVVFSSSSCRETAKNAIKKSTGKDERKTFFFLSTFSANFFSQKFLTWIFSKKFYGVFELPLLRNAQKHHKTNKK
jgi:hypothetical protein